MNWVKELPLDTTNPIYGGGVVPIPMKMDGNVLRPDYEKMREQGRSEEQIERILKLFHTAPPPG